MHHIGGEVVEADVAEAVRWLRVAAEAGVAESYAQLGNQLSALDLYEEALRWYVVGAEKGQASRMLVAGCWYRDGTGTSVDLVQGLRWFLAMLTVGRGDGLHEAHPLVRRMSADDIREASRLAGRPSDADHFLELRDEG